MKKIILLFSLIIIVGCSQFSFRKDQSQHIIFKNSISEGKHNFKLVSLQYPDNYNDKINFLKDLNKTLSNLNNIQKNSLNLLLSKELEIDFNSLLNTGWFDKEIIGVKVVKDLDEEETAFLNSFNIGVPTEAGEFQKLLNKQYFLLLKLTNNQSFYNSDILYTELDKNLLMEDILLSRKSLVANLNSIKKNFVYSNFLENEKKIIYIESMDQDASSLKNKSVIFQNSNINSGFIVLPDSLLLFVGDSQKTFSTKNYDFSSTLITLSSFSELRNIVNSSSAVSNLPSWERKERVKNNVSESLENRFTKWEGK